MAQKIQQANIFGRIGSGIGRGLAEQLPKEIERGRLASGLQQFEQESGNLNPIQQLSRLAAIPGALNHPQLIQSFSDLARQQNIRNAFRGAQGEGNIPNTSPSDIGASPDTMPYQQAFNAARMGNILPDQIQRQVVQGEKIPSDFATRAAEAAALPGLVRENPAKDKFIPTIPWTPAQRDADFAREWDRNPGLTFEQVASRVADNERRYLAAPEGYQKQQDYLKAQEDKASNEFDTQLSTALQKEGNNIYGDLSGSTLLNVKKAMYNDLATNAELTPKTAAEKWMKKAKDFVETKNIIREKANRSLDEKLIPKKKEEILKSLKSAQKQYDEIGNKREFYNMLRTNNNPAKGITGFGLSPGYAALIAYPRSEPLKKVIKDAKIPTTFGFQKGFEFDYPAKSRKLAQDFAKNRSSSDSILAFARELKDEYPYFDENAFFDYLRENQDEYGFSSDQKKELITGVQDMFRNWGDLLLFPITSKRSAVHD